MPGSEEPRLAQIQSAVEDEHVLLVGDWEDFALRGGTINFYLERLRTRGGAGSVKLKLEIDFREAERRRIKTGTKLQKAARIVKEGRK